MPLGMQASIFGAREVISSLQLFLLLLLSQARIKWVGCGRKRIRRKNVQALNGTIYHDHLVTVALCNRADNYIFILFLSSFFFLA